jgi:hypothetical protein
LLARRPVALAAARSEVLSARSLAVPQAVRVLGSYTMPQRMR